MKLKILACALIMLLSTTAVNAEQTDISGVPIDIVVNETFLSIDNPAYMENNITYIPLRTAFEALGASVSWDSGNNSASVALGDTSAVLTYGSAAVTKGVQQTVLDYGLVLKNGVSYVPSRLVGEIANAYVEWNYDYATICIYKDGVIVPSTSENKSYGATEIFWLSRIIEAESSGEPMDGKIAVGNVIMNRVQSADFPNTIYDVIFDTRYSVQFQPISNGTIYNNPSRDSIIAAKRALRGENVVGGSLYFFNPRISKSSWISRNRTYFKTIANHDFYL